MPIGLLHTTASRVALAVYRRGSTPNVGLRAETVVGSNAGIGSHAVPPTPSSGSMQLVAGLTFTVEKNEAYWHQRLLGCGRSPSSLWRSLLSLLGRDRQTSCATEHIADGFATFFALKIAAVWSDTAGLPPPPMFVPASSSLACIRPCTESEVCRIIMSSPVKSSSLDPIPTFLVREFIDILLPDITKMISSSLAAGRLPASQKHAIVTPLKKHSRHG